MIPAGSLIPVFFSFRQSSAGFRLVAVWLLSFYVCWPLSSFCRVFSTSPLELGFNSSASLGRSS